MAKMSIVAVFPEKFFLENLAMRKDRSILVTALNRKELWYVPPQTSACSAVPVRLCSFEQTPAGIIEIEDDVFLICASNMYTSHESFLYRLDLRDWQLGSEVTPSVLLRMPDSARSLNCICMLDSDVALVSDGFGGCIWRIDLPRGEGSPARASVWLRHDSMSPIEGFRQPLPPGVNGIRYSPKAKAIYYTSTGKKLVMRVPVDGETGRPAGDPELISSGRMGDDFAIDEDRWLIYFASHRPNRIECISMEPDDDKSHAIAGDPFASDLIGPTSLIWGRESGDVGKTAFVTTDGGIASPPPDIGIQPAKLLRLDIR